MTKKFFSILIVLGLFSSGVAFAEEDVVENIIMEATQVQVELAESLLSNPNIGYENRCLAVTQMISLMMEGRIGSASEVWSISDAFGFKYDSEMSLHENADRLYRFLLIRKEWYNADDYESISTFLATMAKAVNASSELQEMGVRWDFENETLEFDFENKDISTIVNIMSQCKELEGLTVAEFYDLLIQMAQFHELVW